MTHHSGAKVPIVAAPMAGGPTTPELCAAVADAGGAGVIAGADRSGEEIAKDLAETRNLTRGPIGVNLFVPEQVADLLSAQREFSQYRSYLMKSYSELPVPWPTFEECSHSWSNRDQLEALVAAPPDFVSFTFGYPDEEAQKVAESMGLPVWVTCASREMIDEALRRGLGALIVQGAEAGGHRSVASMMDDPCNETTAELVEYAAAAGARRLTAAGGIRSGRDIATMMECGAEQVQVGTMFLATDESGLSDEGKDLVTKGGGVALTRSFSGRPASGLTSLVSDEAVPPKLYPHINKLTAPLRAWASANREVECQSIWAGDPCRNVARGSAAEIVQRLTRELEEAE